MTTLLVSWGVAPVDASVFAFEGTNGLLSGHHTEVPIGVESSIPRSGEAVPVWINS
jgi:hypothetical protein